MSTIRDRGLVPKGPPIANGLWNSKWSRDRWIVRWCHVTPKSAVRQYDRLS